MELASIYIIYVLTFTTYYFTKTTLINLFKGTIAKGDSLDSENRLRTEKTYISHRYLYILHSKITPIMLRSDLCCLQVQFSC